MQTGTWNIQTMKMRVNGRYMGVPRFPAQSLEELGCFSFGRYRRIFGACEYLLRCDLPIYFLPMVIFLCAGLLFTLEISRTWQRRGLIYQVAERFAACYYDLYAVRFFYVKLLVWFYDNNGFNILLIFEVFVSFLLSVCWVALSWLLMASWRLGFLALSLLGSNPCYQLYTKSFYELVLKPNLSHRGLSITQLLHHNKIT